LPDLVVNFVDRQRLKMLEDKILDLVIIFESLSNTLVQLQRQCLRHCLGPLCENCTCSITIDELEEQMNETRVNLKIVDILQKRAEGAAKLVCSETLHESWTIANINLMQLSDLLEYENAKIAHLNEKSLNRLVEETRDEHSKMTILTVSDVVCFPLFILTFRRREAHVMPRVSPSKIEYSNP
jgi:hypothetical protein